MKKILIKPQDSDSLQELIKLLESSPESKKTFRYYNNRDFSVLNNHLYSAIYYDENDNIVGYGHLDSDDDKIWLGIIIQDDFHSKGYGNYIMDDLLLQTDKPIFLSVDVDNPVAQQLYKKKKFVIINRDNKKIIMVKNG
jgi:predicted GNAT family acetyltransferase